MKKGVIIAISIVSVIVLVLSITMILAWTGVLSKKIDDENLAFRVLQITDVHIKNNKSKDKKAFDTINQMVEVAKPDLIIVTGDITSEHDNMKAFKIFGEYMEGLNIPWTMTFGNHDAEGETDKATLSDYLLTLQNCVYEAGPEDVDGMGNHYINVTNKDGKVITSLIMMDSNMYYMTEEGVNDGYDKFHDNQIAWYEQTIKNIAKEVNGDESKVVDSLAFFHIPMREYDTAYTQSKKDKSKLYGYKFEQVFSSKYDDEMFETMLRLGSTKAVYVGHDHMNSYAVDYKGIRLAYGYSCDHNLYFVPQKGGTVINIKNDGSFTQQGIYRNLGVGKVMLNKAV